MDQRRAIRLYVMLVAATAIGVLVLARLNLGDTFEWTRANVLAAVGLGILALITGAVESRTSAGISGSVVFVSHLAAVVIIGPLGASLVASVAMLVSQVWMKREAIKIVFNVAQITLCTLLGGVVYLEGGGHLRPEALENQDFVAYGVLVVVYFAVNSAAVSGAVAITQKKPFTHVWQGQLLRAAGYDLVASALGLLIAWMYVRFGFWSIFAVTVPILALRQAYRENVELKRLNAELLEHHRELLEYTVKQIEARDPYTSGHSRRVAQYAEALAREFGLPQRQVEEVTTAALLHDVGKIYHEFGSVLQKEGRLTPDEKQLLQSHPVRSAELIGTISNLRGSVELAVRHHHENFDGTGYPEGLAGDQIPIGSRIIMIADTLDAMTTDRPYRRALPFERVLEEMRKYAGKQFDPRLADLAIRSTAIRRLVAVGSQSSIASSSPALNRAKPAWATKSAV
ncbi:MAG TPA: HD-GYP domain-containing protein [Gemmatimonadales bacterium]|jgi:putative nucleotidyltransferase with HDIG domain|nr:HD-GYP domain-containing protein [Gemmatimonadales bacterium]